MHIPTHVGLNFSQVPTSVEDIHICYLQYTIYKSFLIASYFDRDIPSRLNSSSSNFTTLVNAGAFFV